MARVTICCALIGATIFLSVVATAADVRPWKALWKEITLDLFNEKKPFLKFSLASARLHKISRNLYNLKVFRVCLFSTCKDLNAFE
jgi:hypothetical protein